MEGKSYKGIQKVEGRRMHISDKAERKIGDANCGRRCTRLRQCDQITGQHRKDIHSKFWLHMNWDEKQIYIASLVERTAPVKTTVAEGNSRRGYSYQYFLEVGTERFRVCKSMFLSTLGIGEHTLYGWIETTDDNGMRKQKVDRIKRQVSSEKTEKAKEILEKLPKVESHYCRFSTERQYVEPLYRTFTELFNSYKDYCTSSDIPPISRPALLRCFQSMNLSIYHPRKDQCDVCSQYEAGTVEQEEYDCIHKHCLTGFLLINAWYYLIYLTLH